MSRVTVQIFRRAAWKLCALSLCVLSFDCMNKPLTPVAPTWETQMTAPVSLRSYTLADIVARDTSVLAVTPGTTQLVYGTTVQADPTFVGNLLSISAFSSASQIQVGSYAVDGTSYAMDVPFPSWFPRGMTATIPGATIPFAPLTGKLPGLDSVTFTSGTVELHVRNNLPVAVTIQNPISLLDSGGNVRGTFDFTGGGPIQPGSESAAAMNLAGMFLTQTVTLSGLTLAEPGSTTPLPVPADSLIVATLIPRNPVVSSALVTSLPAQMAASNVTRSLAVRDSDLVKDLTVKSGTITIHFQSSIPVNASFSYSIGEILTPSGLVYADQISLPAHGSFDRRFNLAGYRLHSPDGSFITSLDLTGSLSLTQINGGAPVRIQGSDNVSFTVSSTAITADTIVGVMKPTWVAVNTALPVDLGDLSKKFKGHVNIPEATLTLLPQSSIRFPLELDLKLQAEGSRGQVLSEMDVPKTTFGGSLQPIPFPPGEVGKFLSTISGQLPDSLRVSGAVILNPAYDISTPGSAGSNSWFGGQVQVSFPLTFSLTGGAFSDTAAIGDTSGSGQGRTLLDAKTAGNISSIRLHVVTDNTIPLQASVKLNFLDRSRRLLLSLPQSAGDSIAIPPPLVACGAVQSPSHGERIIELAGTEVQQFNNAYSLAYAMGTSTTGSDAVRFESIQSIRIRVWAEFSYQVNK